MFHGYIINFRFSIIRLINSMFVELVRSSPFFLVSPMFHLTGLSCFVQSLFDTAEVVWPQADGCSSAVSSNSLHAHGGYLAGLVIVIIFVYRQEIPNNSDYYCCNQQAIKIRLCHCLLTTHALLSH